MARYCVNLPCTITSSHSHYSSSFFSLLFLPPLFFILLPLPPLLPPPSFLTQVQQKVMLKYDSWHREILSRFGTLLGDNMRDFHTTVAKVGVLYPSTKSAIPVSIVFSVFPCTSSLSPPFLSRVALSLRTTQWMQLLRLKLWASSPSCRISRGSCTAGSSNWR